MIDDEREQLASYSVTQAATLLASHPAIQPFSQTASRPLTLLLSRADSTSCSLPSQAVEMPENRWEGSE